MPNWAENQLIISGDTESIQALRAFIAGTNNRGEHLPFDFNKVIPIPEELDLTTSPNNINAQAMMDKYGYADWYDFKCTRWGTKWNLSEVEVIETDDNVLEMRFDTAWSPPEGIILQLSILFPELHFELWSCDPACDWGFHMVCDLGGLITCESTTCNETFKDRFNIGNWDEDETDTAPETETNSI